MKRHTVKSQPVARSSTPTIKGVHAHGCLVCGERYEDNCSSPLANGRCQVCVGRRTYRLPWEISRQPKACCMSAQLVTDVGVLERYGLGGELPWYQCSGPNGCYRTFPYHPSTRSSTRRTA